MADTVTTLSLITLAQEFRGSIVRNVNRKVVLARLIRCVPGSSKNISWGTEFDGQHFENYAEGADATNFSSDAQGQATLQWALYRSNFHLTELAMDAAASTGTPLGNQAIWARNLVNASAKTASAVNSLLFTGAGTGTTICGLDNAIAAGNTYAGVDRTNSANALWRSYVVDNSGSPVALTLTQIRTDVAAIKRACGESPDAAIVGLDTFNKVVALFDATRRQIEIIQGGAGEVRLAATQQAVEVDGVVFIADKDCAEGKIYYLNWDHMHLEYLPSVYQTKMMAAGMAMEANDGFGAFPLGISYSVLAKNGASERAMCRTTVQLVVEKPNCFGVRLGVA